MTTCCFGVYIFKIFYEFYDPISTLPIFKPEVWHTQMLLYKLYLKFVGPHDWSIFKDNMHNCIYVSLRVEAYGAAIIVIAVAAWSEPRIACN
jgi:hypothetical protein